MSIPIASTVSRANNGWNMRTDFTSSLIRNSGVNEYYEYMNMGNEIRQALEEARMQGQNLQVQPAGNTAAAEAEAAIAAAAATAAGAAEIDDPELAARIAKMKAFQELTPEQQQAYYEEQLRKAQEAAAKMQGLQTAAVTEGGAEAVLAGGAAAAAAMAAPSQVKCPWCGSMRKVPVLRRRAGIRSGPGKTEIRRCRKLLNIKRTGSPSD